MTTIESVVGLTTQGMIVSNASDEEMSEEKSLAMCKVALGSFIFVKRRQVGTTKDFFEVVLA